MLSFDDIQQCGDHISPVAPAAAPGNDSDVVISSRVRLARNFAAWPFESQLNDADRAAVLRHAKKLLAAVRPRGLTLFELFQCDPLERLLLVERHLISPELAACRTECAVAISDDRSLSVMIHEEDHLRIQAMVGGFDLQRPLEMAMRLESDLSNAGTAFAISEEFGYLTACPTNIGSAMRAGVMLHLPGLIRTGQMDRAARALAHLHLTLRGIYGEHSTAPGDLFQISNRISFGKTEQETIELLEGVVPDILEYEREARTHLLTHRGAELRELLGLTIRSLSDADASDIEETMDRLSVLRLGTVLGLVTELTPGQVDELFVRTQPAHIQKRIGHELEPADIDMERARILRESLHR